MDIKHIEWLTKFLIGYEKAYLVVSHDEAFLKAIADTVIAVENKGLTRYKGNFDYYLQEREIRFLMTEKSFVAQQKIHSKTRNIYCEEFSQSIDDQTSSKCENEARKTRTH